MKVEVLVATMNFDGGTELLEKMNIGSDVIVCNQGDTDAKAEFEYKSKSVTVLSSSDRGVGKNRNKGLFHSTADVVVFADNDVRYVDDYAKTVSEYYEQNPKAEVVIFNFKVKRGDSDFNDVNKKDKKATGRDVTRFGTYAISAKREALLKKRISFSLLFGGGAKYQCGEDSLFLRDCYKSGLKIYLCSKTLGKVEHNESTWFTGVNEKYCYDKGALFGAMFGKTAWVYLLYHAFKHRKTYATIGKFSKVYALMKKGAREFLGK